MNEPADQVAKLTSAALNLAEQLPASMNLEDSLSAIQAYSTLALAQAQDRANELKRIEILVALSNGKTYLSELAYEGLFVPNEGRLRPSIAVSLGLGGESE